MSNICRSIAILMYFVSLASAQFCNPYWAGLQRLQLAGPSIGYASYDDGSGPTVYAAKDIPVVYYRWHKGQWHALPDEGLPAERGFAYNTPYTLDDGSGPALYSLIQTSASETGAVRWRDHAWSLMPPAFWQYDPRGQGLPMTSADLGDGMHIYGGLSIGRVVRWNGQSWEQIGLVDGSARSFSAMIGYDDGREMALYVFGQFDTVDGVQAHGFARWDGHTWTGPWPEGVGSQFGAPLLTVFDDGNGARLYTNFVVAIGGTSRIGLHRWDGITWEFLGGPDTLAPEFDGLHAFDDGSGPALYITGIFSNFAGLPARNLVRYDIHGFHLVPGSDMWGHTWGIGVIRDARGESFAFKSGTQGLQTVGQWVGCPSCPADCNADGRLNVLDFICFLNAYAAFDPFANAQPDGVFDLSDFMAFMNRFAAGCP